VLKIQDYAISDEPYYQAIADEIDIFSAAYTQQLPVLLKGPTGCGKTRFMEHMAWRLKRPLDDLHFDCAWMTRRYSRLTTSSNLSHR